MSFSFGSTTTATQPAQGGQQSSLFSSAPKPTSSFSFGSTPAAPSNSSTSLFGQPQQQQQQQPAQQSTSLFGAQPQQQQAGSGGGLFGGGGTGGGGLFGSTTANQPQQQQQQPTGGLFGSANTAQQPATGGLFGSTTGQTQTQPSGGVFGSTNTAGQQQQQAGGTGLFGSANQQQQQPQTGGGLFGSTNQANTGGSLFGGGSTQPGAGGSSLFGGGNTNQQSQFQQQPQQGQQLQQQQGQGQQANGNLGQSTLWKSTIGGGVSEPDIETRMMGVKNAWDPSSAEYRFKTFVYNVVDQGTTHQYGRQQGFSDELWAMAQRENPDPTTRVPVLVNGPQDLQKRRQKQIEMAAMQQHISKEISSALRHTRQKAWATDARTRNLQARQTHLHDRLSRLVFSIDQALPPEGSSDASTTADIIQKLEGGKIELDGGSLKSRGGAKESLRAQVNTLRGRIAELRRYPIKQDSGDVGWLADPDAQAKVAEILTQHQVALEGLTKMLSNMEFEEGVVAKGLADMGEARH